jgi:phosphoribosyl-ATP pyrophosphohydrolase/phosphoribosyl-AMP cyclohydrolase
LLIGVRQDGAACHTGAFSCFYNELLPEEDPPADSRILGTVRDVIEDRRRNPREGSYTNYLFEKGIDKMCKKVGEEAAEVIIAAKNRDPAEVRRETADLFYHVLVVLAEQGVPLEDVYRELAERHADKGR